MNINALVGKTVLSVEVTKETYRGDTINFKCTDGSEYSMYHDQDCCEHVYLENEEGLKGLEGQKIIDAYESSNSGNDVDGESCTWTFYNIQGEKSFATLRWFGSSNGYYSESVDFYETKKPDEVIEEEKSTDVI